MKFLIVVLLCIIPPCVMAQTDTEFIHISSRDGLPSNDVHGITQDRKGYLWIGTRRGLVQYDGHGFREKIPQIGYGRIQSLASSAEDLVLSCNGNGENREGLYIIQQQGFQNTLLQKLNFSDSDPTNDHFEHIFVDSQQRIWACDQLNVKFYDLRKRKLFIFPLIKGLSNNIYLADFQELPNRNMLILSKYGVYEFSDKIHKKLDISVQTFCQVFGNASAFYVVLTNGEFGVLDTKTYQYRKLVTPDFVGSWPQCMAAIDAQTLWFGTGQRIVKYHIATNVIENFDEFLTEPANIRCIFRDNRTQSFWFGSDRGIFRYRETKPLIANIKIPETVAKRPFVVKQFLEQNNSVLLGLSQGGILEYSTSSKSYKSWPLPPKESVTALQKDAKGMVWVGTSRGVYQMQGSKLKLIIPNVSVVDLAFDGQNKLWVMPYKAPIRVFDAQMKTLTLWKKMPESYWTTNLFNDLQPDVNGRMWLAAWFPKGFGAVFYDETKQELVELTTITNDRNMFIGDFFMSAFACPNGEVIMSAFGGFNRFDKNGKILQRFDGQSDTLADTHCSFIAQDLRQRVWVATQEGLHIIDNKKITRITEYDGLTSNSLLHGFLLSKTNKVWVGQYNGFDLINIPTYFAQSSVLQDSIRLSRCFVSDVERQIDWSKKVVLSRNENTLRWDFTTLNFEPTYKNRFRYRFVGKDGAWTDLGSNRTVSLLNLGPDDYVLEVQAGNSQGNWYPKTWRGRFSIKRAIYESVWFYVLIVIIVGAVLYALYRFRLRQIELLQQMREKISRDLHDEVGSTVSGIAIIGKILNQQIGQQTDKLGNLTEQIVDDAQRIGSTLDDIIWSVKPQNDTLDGLFARMKRHAASLLEAKGIDYSMTTEGDTMFIKMTMEQRYDIFLIFKEAINNLIKYSEATEVNIDLVFDKQHLFMNIEDNGIGFEVSQKTDRHGLRNMRKRTESWGGVFKILSKKNEGTKIQVKVPIATT